MSGDFAIKSWKLTNGGQGDSPAPAYKRGGVSLALWFLFLFSLGTRESSHWHTSGTHGTIRTTHARTSAERLQH